MWSEVGPGVDQEGTVEVVEELPLVAVLEQPGVALDAASAVLEVERAGLTLGVATRDGGEAVGWVHSPELIGHEVVLSVVAQNLVEGDVRLESEVEVERVQDALGHRERW
jgi:hypothetical protein